MFNQGIVKAKTKKIKVCLIVADIFCIELSPKTGRQIYVLLYILYNHERYFATVDHIYTEVNLWR